jgi:hypothetical protein
VRMVHRLIEASFAVGALLSTAPASAQMIEAAEGEIRMLLDPAAPELSCVVVRTSGDPHADDAACEKAKMINRTGDRHYPTGTRFYGDINRHPAECRVKGEPVAEEYRAMCARHVAAMRKSRMAMAIAHLDWLQPSDFDALEGPGGRGTLRLAVDENGRAIYCIPFKSSGNPMLDKRACEAMLRRARYEPALNSAGEPTPSIDHRIFNWSK